MRSTRLYQKRKNDLLFILLKYLLIAGIALTALVLVTKPLRYKWSNNYIENGDAYLAQKKYLQAELEYKKAEMLYKKNGKIVERMALAEQSQSDIMKLEPFYREKNISLELDFFVRSKLVPKDETEATKNCKYLIEHEEYQLAVEAGKTATEMNPSYRDGWLYLGIANLRVSENVQLNSSAKEKYLAAAIEALNKAKQIDPEYKPTLDFIKEAGGE